jgi:hypothetical protein
VGWGCGCLVPNGHLLAGSWLPLSLYLSLWVGGGSVWGVVGSGVGLLFEIWIVDASIFVVVSSDTLLSCTLFCCWLCVGRWWGCGWCGVFLLCDKL